MKPQLANDASLNTLKYSVFILPKIDGIRGLNTTGRLTGRSLKEFEGYGVTEMFSKPYHKFLDGELILGINPASSERLCSLTTGAVGAFKGVTQPPNLHFWVFDWLEDLSLPYRQRYEILVRKVQNMGDPRVHLVPAYECKNREELDFYIFKFLQEGYEGAVIRNPDAPAKQGRPSKVKQEFVRVKPWHDSEMLVTGVTEGNENTNEATVNELGYTERSSAFEGLVANGRVGSIQGILLEDCISPITGQLLFPKGLEITVSKGCMTHEEARFYFENQNQIVGHIVKFKHFIHGTKTLPRMGQYLSHRLPQDL
jgi:DNA ligase-1